MKKPEKYCPKCKNIINWKTVHSALGAPSASGICEKCNIVFKDREAFEITKGKEMAKDFEGISCLDKNFTKLSGTVQLGILRARQHSRK